eukprot:6144309-Pyramimonas_sp.AAC.1
MGVLGPYLPGGEGWRAGAMQRRCEAMLVACRQRGRFWPSDTTDKLNNICVAGVCFGRRPKRLDRA